MEELKTHLSQVGHSLEPEVLDRYEKGDKKGIDLLVKELKEKYGLAVLMTEQNFNQAIKIADRGYIIVEGKIEFEGKDTAELSEHELVKKFYLGV